MTTKYHYGKYHYRIEKMLNVETCHEFASDIRFVCGDLIQIEQEWFEIKKIKIPTRMVLDSMDFKYHSATDCGPMLLQVWGPIR